MMTDTNSIKTPVKIKIRPRARTKPQAVVPIRKMDPKIPYTNTDTTVSNVKVKHIRPKYKDLSLWLKDPNNIYIGRTGIVFVPTDSGGKERCPKQSSIWQNPFKIKVKSGTSTSTSTREDVIAKYKEYIYNKIIDDDLVDKLLLLKGKNLGCWCKPEPCHGDILVEMISLFDRH